MFYQYNTRNKNNKNKKNNINNNNDKHNMHKMYIMITKLFLLSNAIKLGWTIESINSNKIIISKKTNKLTKVDKNTIKLIKRLFSP